MLKAQAGPCLHHAPGSRKVGGPYRGIGRYLPLLSIPAMTLLAPSRSHVPAPFRISQSAVHVSPGAEPGRGTLRVLLPQLAGGPACECTPSESGAWGDPRRARRQRSDLSATVRPRWVHRGAVQQGMNPHSYRPSGQAPSYPHPRESRAVPLRQFLSGPEGPA